MVGMPPDLQYCFDHMMESHEMTGDIYEFYFSIRKDAVNFLDNSGVGIEVLKEDYNLWRETAKPLEKALLTIKGVDSLSFQKHDYLKAVTNDAIVAAGKKPSKKLIIDHMYIGVTQERFINNFDTLASRLMEDLNQIDFGQLIDLANKKEKQKFEFYNKNHPWTINKIPNKEEIRKKRKVLTKSVDLMSNFFSKEDTKLFLGKENVSITGTDFDFEINAKDFNSNFHGALTIRVMDKEGNRLSNLCFYYENMPAPDQITAFLLDVQSGNEQKILKIGNIYNLTDEGYSHKLLAEINPQARKKEWPHIPLADLIEPMIPGSKLIHKYHSECLPIVKEIVNNKLKEKLTIMDHFVEKFKKERKQYVLV